MTAHSLMPRRDLLLPLSMCAAFLVIGLLTLDAYGATWDEPLHRGWGESVWAYMLSGDQALISDLPGGGRYYGPLFYILSYGVSEFAHTRLGMSFTAANHLLTLVAATFGLLCTFLLAQTLSTRRAAAVATLLLILLPHFVAHAHYNPKDIPLLALSVATLLFAAHTYRSRLRRHAALTGMFLGIALSMKPTVVVLLPVVAAAVLADIFARRAWSRAELRSITLMTGVSALAATVSFVLAWPTLWRDPYIFVETLHYFGLGNFWTGDVLYFGDLAFAADLPWHYMPVMLLLSIPLVALALAAAGTIALIGQVRRSGDTHGARPDRTSAVFSVTLLVSWIVLPLIMFMKPGLPRYDGIRQIFFMVPAIMILGGIGFDSLWRLSTRSKVARRMALAVVAIVAGWLVLESARWFPYGGSYVNAPARALLGPHLERQFEIEYWGASYREGARWLQANAPVGSVICVPVASQVLDWQPDALRDDLVMECDGADYVMLITRTSQWPEEYAWLSDTQALFTVSRAGSALMRVYQIANHTVLRQPRQY